MNRIDYDLIVNELSKGLKDHADPVVQACGFWRTLPDGKQEYCGVGHYYFKEFRTIGLSVPRQMGKTRWIASRLIDNEKACAITRDDNLVKWYGQFFDERPNAMSQVYSTAAVQDMSRNGTLPKYDTYYIDDARHIWHFIERSMHQYFIDSNQLSPTIILVG